MIPDKPVLLTGASGQLGTVLAHALGEKGWRLRLTDRRPFPGELPRGAVFIPADLEDGVAILRMAEGCGTIIHFGGIPVEEPFETVIGPNIRGIYHVYEAARRENARMVYASSHHAAGFQRRSRKTAADDSFRPDGYYGMSKAYGELMGQLYWDKHGVESVHLRIGVCKQVPDEARMLSSWLSLGDLVTLVERSVLANIQRPAVIWGVSNNSTNWWTEDDRELIGWTPKDSSDNLISALKDKVSQNPIEELYQGAWFAARDYTRGEPSPE